MAVNLKKTIGAGLDNLLYGFVDSSGYLIGSTTTAPTAGNQDGSGLARLTKAKSFPFAPVDPDRPTATGDDGAAARFLFKPVDLPEFNFTLACGDLTFETAVQSLLTHNLGGFTFAPVQSEDTTYVDTMFLVSSQAKAQDTGSVGSSYWENLLVLKTNIFPRGRTSIEERAVATYEYAGVANYAGTYPWGLAFSVLNNGTVSTAALRFTSPYRPYIQRWTGDNTVTSFNLTKNIAEDSANNVVAYVNGVASTWVTGAPGAGEFGITESTTDTLVFGTAPAASAKVVALYGVTAI